MKSIRYDRGFVGLIDKKSGDIRVVSLVVERAGTKRLKNGNATSE